MIGVMGTKSEDSPVQLDCTWIDWEEGGKHLRITEEKSFESKAEALLCIWKILKKGHMTHERFLWLYGCIVDSKLPDGQLEPSISVCECLGHFSLETFLGLHCREFYSVEAFKEFLQGSLESHLIMESQAKSLTAEVLLIDGVSMEGQIDDKNQPHRVRMALFDQTRSKACKSIKRHRGMRGATSSPKEPSSDVEEEPSG